jgi:hypothetical protein
MNRRELIALLLSVEEYTSILVVAQNDPVVREKIVQRIRSSPK